MYEIVNPSESRSTRVACASTIKNNMIIASDKVEKEVTRNGERGLILEEYFKW